MELNSILTVLEKIQTKLQNIEEVIQEKEYNVKNFQQMTMQELVEYLNSFGDEKWYPQKVKNLALHFDIPLGKGSIPKQVVDQIVESYKKIEQNITTYCR